MELFSPFAPHYGATQALTITAAQSTIVYPAGSNSFQLALTNVGSAVVFVRVQPTSDTTAATAADMPVLPNAQVIITKATGDPVTLRATAAGAGSTLYVTPGIGF